MDHKGATCLASCPQALNPFWEGTLENALAHAGRTRKLAAAPEVNIPINCNPTRSKVDYWNFYLKEPTGTNFSDKLGRLIAKPLFRL